MENFFRTEFFGDQSSDKEGYFSITMSSESVLKCIVRSCSAQTLNAVLILIDSHEQKQVNDSVFVVYELLKTRSLAREKLFLKIQSVLSFCVLR